MPSCDHLCATRGPDVDGIYSSQLPLNREISQPWVNYDTTGEELLAFFLFSPPHLICLRRKDIELNWTANTILIYETSHKVKWSLAMSLSAWYLWERWWHLTIVLFLNNLMDNLTSVWKDCKKKKKNHSDHAVDWVNNNRTLTTSNLRTEGDSGF